ncbi:MAG TPA: Gfo/Idh/MocA family oxidoreductase, partial [Pirellulales bacterium]|nr:Gfo/Idh/MocA family oxidoreductase [Pirellulales bacterium]
FSYFNRNPDDVRNQATIGGGALMDIGCYPISVARWVFDAEPTRVRAQIDRDPEFGTDRTTSAILEFGPHTANFICGTQLAPYQRVHLVGTEGRVEIEIPFNAPPDRPCRIWHQTATGIEEISFPLCDQYTIQGDLFSRTVIDDTPVPTPITDAVANMRVIEAVLRAAGGGR